MSKRKDFVKTLKSPDTFQKTVGSTFERFYEFRIIIGVIILAVIIIFGSIIGIKQYQQAQIKKRRQNLAQIEKKYEDIEKQIASKQTALSGQIDKLKSKKDKKSKQKLKELEASLNTLKPDFHTLLNDYEIFYKKFNNTPEGWFAALRIANIELSNNNLKKAKEILQKLLAQSTGYTFYQIHARNILINVLEELGEYKEAVNQVNMLLPLIPDQSKPKILLIKLRLQVAQKDKAGAKKTLEVITTKYASSSEASEARAIKHLFL